MRSCQTAMNASIVGIAGIVLAFAVLPVSADTIGFDGLGIAEGDTLGTIPTRCTEVTFSDAVLVLPGETPLYIGFNGNSSGSGLGGADDANSGPTIATRVIQQGSMNINFAAPVENLSVDLADVEVGGVTEIVRLTIFTPGGTQIGAPITITGGDPGTGDGVLTPVAFTGASGIGRLEVLADFVPDPEATLRGWALDNLAFTCVLPTATESVTWGRLKSRRD